MTTNERPSRIDVVQAIVDGREKVCTDCANKQGGFDAGWRKCDDGRQITCACGKTDRPTILATY